MADVKLIIQGDASNAKEMLRELQLSGTTCASVMEREFNALWVKSSLAIQGQRDAYVSAFEKIRASGLASAAEIARAQDALQQKLSGMDREEGLKKAEVGAKGLSASLTGASGCVDRLHQSFLALNAGVQIWFVGGKLWAGFKAGIDAVDQFQMSVIQTSAMITSLQGGDKVAENYRKAKVYAEGLNVVLQQVDSKTTLNLQNLQTITEEMVKQGVVLDYNNQGQVEGFTRLANAVAVYSRNGANEIQVRQEVAALLRGEVDQNSQLASMLQKTVQGPLREHVEKWKQSGTLITEIGARLSGFGEAAKDLNTTWGAVKSSFETTLNLLLRSGFNTVVRDVAKWLSDINDYLKIHQELVGEKITNAWQSVKGGLSAVEKLAKLVLEHTTAVGVLLTSGLVIQGLTIVTGMFSTMKTVVLGVRDAVILMNTAMALTPAAAGAGAAGGAVEVGAGAAAGAGAVAAMLGKLKPLLAKLRLPLSVGVFASMMTSDSVMSEAEEQALLKARRGTAPGAAEIPKIEPAADAAKQKELLKQHKKHLDERLALYKEHNEQFLKQEETKYKLLMKMEENNAKFIKESIASLDKQIAEYLSSWKSAHDTITGIEAARSQARNAAADAALTDFEREQKAIQGLIDRQARLNEISDPKAQLKEAEAIAKGWNDIATAIDTDINKVTLVDQQVAALKGTVEQLGKDHTQSLVDQKNKMSELWYDAQTQANAYKTTLDLIKGGLDALNNSTIKIGFEITGLDQVQNIIDMNRKALGLGGSAVNNSYNPGASSSGGVAPQTSSSINAATIGHYGANLDRYFSDTPSFKSVPFMGGFATGTPYVPQTGLALIHQGERIIPAAENSRNMSTGSGSNVNITINTVDLNNPRSVAKQIFGELQQLQGRIRA